MSIFDFSIYKLLAATTVLNVGIIIYDMFSCTGYLADWWYIASHDSLLIIKYVLHLNRTIPNWKFNVNRDVVNAALEASWPVVVGLVVIEILHLIPPLNYLPKLASLIRSIAQ